MTDDALFRLLEWVEGWGIGPSWTAWITVLGTAIAMAFVLQRERSRAAWQAAAVIAGFALVAHLADYFVTLHRSPDLALEANPLWRNVVERYGLTVAKWYGLTGKLLVSIIAGEMAAFYVAQRHRLYPVEAGSLPQFVRGLGARSRTMRERFAALFTVFCFFFAGLSFFYFYVAFQNWMVGDPRMAGRLPPITLAVLLYVLGLCVAFVVITYDGYRRFRLATALQAAAAAVDNMAARSGV